MTARTEEIATLLGRIPDSAVRRLFTPEFVLCCEEFDRFTTAMVLRLIQDLELERFLDRSSTVAEIVAARGWAPRSEIPLEWFFRKLAREGLLEAKGTETEASYRARGPLPPGDPDRPQERARAIDPRSMPPFEVVRVMAQHIPEFLKGEKTGEEILFSPARLGLWFDYFSNDNLLYQINNRLGAEAVVRTLPVSRPARIVEIGGGSGSAAAALFERLAAEGGLERIERYTFTEIVPTFLRRAERSLKSRFPNVPIDFLRLDMDREFEAQGVARGGADVVYAVNTIHIAKSLAATLASIRETLMPGGFLVLSECIRPLDRQPIYVEFVFNFLENFTRVETDAHARPNHGFLTPENWRKSLAAAGFERPEILPDVEELARHYDAFFVAGVSARRPR